MASAATRSTISFGTPAGAMMPAQVPETKSGTPCSMMVFTPGAAGIRSFAASPSALTLPAVTCGISGPTMSNITLMLPATVSCSAPAVPL